MLSEALLRPPVCRQSCGEGCEAFEIKGDYEIDVPRESSELNEAEERRGTDDHDVGMELSGDHVELREVLQLWFCEHDAYVRNCWRNSAAASCARVSLLVRSSA